MKLTFTLLLLLCTVSVFSQTCPPNIDFETGNFSNWQCFTGSTGTANGKNVFYLSPSAPFAGRHEIISAANTQLNDVYGNFPRLCPYGGNYSIKLGNDNIGAEAEGLSYTFQIPPSADTFSLTYYYAVVFQDPGHASIDQPRFFVSAYDVVTGALIDCASYNYISTASIPGFKISTFDPSVLYKEWSPASIDFSGLAGRTVRLEFKTADCTLGGHFGYAYVDVGTGCGGVIAAAALCGSTNSVILNAPYGFQTYTWYNANYTVVAGTQQTVTLIPPPAANTLFHVDMVPYPGYGCRDTADALVSALPVPDTPVAVTNYNYCQLQSSQQLTATPLKPNSLIWYTSATGGVGGTTAPVPSTVNPGIASYYVTQKKLFGCESERKEIKVNVSLTPVTSFSINNARQCQNTNNFIFTGATTNTLANSIYKWDFGDGDTSLLINANHTYTNYGNYTVKLKVLNPPVCFNEKQTSVYVVAKPIAKFSYPQTVCENQTIIFLTDNSTVPGGVGIINNWQWAMGAANVTAQTPPGFLASGGPLLIKLVAGTSEGCKSDTSTVSLPVHYQPTVKIKKSAPLCSNEIIDFYDLSALPAAASPDYINAWNWQLDNTLSSMQKDFSMNLPQGIHNVKLISQTNIGCKSILSDSSFTVYEKPQVQLGINDSCINRNIQYTATFTGSTGVTEWLWDFGKGFKPDAQNLVKRFSKEGYHPLSVIGKSIQGCKDTITRPFTIYQNHSFAGHDTIVARGQPIQLNAGGGATVFYTWSPATGLNNTQVENPVATLDRDQLYELNSMSVYGCDSYSKIFIKRYKGPELFIPTAFTPNDDGLNDVLKVFPVGYKIFYSFAVYDRFGLLLFYTKDYNKGWDGKYRGIKSEPGNYVVLARALDYNGNNILTKGNVLLLR